MMKHKRYKEIFEEVAKTVAGIEKVEHIAGPGTFEKIAVIGTDSKNRVKPFAEKLRQLGFEVEVFQPSKEALEQWDKLRNNEYSGQLVPESEVYNTLLFKENVMWREMLRRKGYDILDIGGNRESTFYNMEKDPIWQGGNPKSGNVGSDVGTGGGSGSSGGKQSS